MMRKRAAFRPLFALAMLLAVSLPALAATAALSIEPGSYTMTAVDEWDRVKNDDRYYSELPTLPGKPAYLQADLTEQELAAATYSAIRLGDAGDLIHLAFGNTGGKTVDFLYVDANNDLILAAEEKVEIEKNSPYSYENADVQRCETIKPVACTVGYKRAEGTIVTRPISVEFFFIYVTPTGKSKLAPVQYHSYLVNTWFTGTASFKIGGDTRQADFALIDGDDNGIYNDFGRDVMLVDTNGDGTFDLKKEIYPLTEFDEVKLDRKTVAQRRRTLFAWPAVLIVQGAKEPLDPRAVEPE